MRCAVLIEREGLPNDGDLIVEAEYLNDPGDLYSLPDVGWEIESVTAAGRDVEHLLNEDDYDRIYWQLDRQLPQSEEIE